MLASLTLQPSAALRVGQRRLSRGRAAAAPRPAGGRRAAPVAPRAGLLDFFKAPAKAEAKQPARAAELVEQLLAATLPTAAGDKATDAQREQIAALVDELEGFCPKAPLQSPLLWGEWDVVYAARPGTIAGPFKSPVGRVVFPGLESSQVLAPPNLCTNKANFKTLGFIPGGVKQEGYFEPIDAYSFKLIFPQQDGKRPGGPRERLITIAYLDENVRVARFTPAEGDAKSQPTFYVFTRRQAKQQAAEAAEPEAPRAQRPAARGSQRRGAAAAEEEEEAAPARKGPAFGLLAGKKEGLATQVERSYYNRRSGTGSSSGTEAQRSGPTGTRALKRPTWAAAPAAEDKARPGTARRGTGTVGKAAAPAPAQTAAERAAARKAAEAERAREREAAAAARAAAAKEAAAARERAAREAAEARAAAEAERRAAAERQAAERKAAAERAAAVRAQLAELTGEAKAADEDARNAAKAAKDAEKDAAPALRQAQQARQLMEQAVAAAVAAAQKLQSLKEEEKDAGREVEAAKKLLRQLEALNRGK